MNQCWARGVLQFATVEVIVTSVKDSGIFDKYFCRHEILVAVICFIIFLVGIPYIFEVSPLSSCYSPSYAALYNQLPSRIGRHLYLPTGWLLRVGHIPHVHRFLRVHRHRVALWGQTPVCQYTWHDWLLSQPLLPILLVDPIAPAHLCYLGWFGVESLYFCGWNLLEYELLKT